MRPEEPGLHLSGAVAFLVLLAATAGAGIVASDLGAAHHLLGGVRPVAAEVQLRQFALLLALNVAGEILHRGLRRFALLVTRAGPGGRRLFLLLVRFWVRTYRLR